MFARLTGISPRVATGWPLALNWGHPLAQDLRFLFVTIDGQMIDLVAETLATNNGTITSRATDTPWAGGDLDSTDYWSVADDDAHNITGPITLIWRGVIDTGSAFRHFAGKHAGAGALLNPFDFRTNNAAAPAVFLGRASAAAAYSHTSSIIVPLRAPVTVAVAQGKDSDEGGKFFIDGKVQTFGAFGFSRTPEASTTGLRIGRRTDGVVQMDGVVEYVAGYARELTVGELGAFQIGLPADLVTPAGPRIFVPAAAPGGGAVGGVLWSSIFRPGRSIAA